MIKKIYKHFMTDPLYRNSIFIMASTFVMAVLGFFFWIIVARLFSTENVGIATTLISAVSLLSNLSLLGFNVGLIRYLPKSLKQNPQISSATYLVSITSIVSSVIFIFGLHLFSPKLEFLQTNIIYSATFIFFVLTSTASLLLEGIFMAYRASGNILIKNTFISVVKLLLPIVLTAVGGYGIFASVTLATFVGALVGFVTLIVKFNYHPTFSFSTKVIREMSFFSGSSYLANFIASIPTLVLPLIIVNKLNSTTAAYYYIASMILGFLTIIPSSASNSYLAEGVHNSQDLLKHFLKTLKIIYAVLTPTVFVTFFFGVLILHAFGKNYASEAFTFLRIVSISSLFIAITYLGGSTLRLRHQMKKLIAINTFGTIVTVVLCYLFLGDGLTGIGYGWLVGQIVRAFIYSYVLFKEFAILVNLKSNIRKYVVNYL